jgi:hypothetical protein
VTVPSATPSSAMTDPALGHPASRVRSGRASAPAPIAVTIMTDVCLFVCAGVLALIDAPAWWSSLVLLFLGIPILVVYGRRAAEAQGIKSRDEMPYGSLMALGIPGGVIGVLTIDVGRYAGLLLMTYLVMVHIGERIIWARFRAARQADIH